MTETLSPDKKYSRKFGRYLKRARYTIDPYHNISVRELSQRSGLSSSFLSKVENGGRGVPRPDTLRKIAKGLGVSDDYIFRLVLKSSPYITDKTLEPWIRKATKQSGKKTGIHNTEDFRKVNGLVKIPVLGEIACGDPITAIQNVNNYKVVAKNDLPHLPIKTLFCLHCVGHSMEPMIPDGSSVLMKAQPVAETGQIVAVLMHGQNEVTLKKYRRLSSKEVLLIPLNPKYKSILLTKKNPGRIVGIALRVSTNLPH